MPFEKNPIYLDLRDLNCPLPVLRTRKLLKTLDPGAAAIVACTDPLAVIDIPHLLHTTGDMLESYEARDGLYIFHIRRCAGDAPKKENDGSGAPPP